MGGTTSYLQSDGTNSNAVVTLYTGPSFNGYSTRITESQLNQLENGEVNDLSSINFLDKALMSLKVAPGYKVKLYTRPAREGNSMTIEGPQDVADLANFSNTVSSLKVERINKTNLQQQSGLGVWFWILLVILILLILWAIYDHQKKGRLYSY